MTNIHLCHILALVIHLAKPNFLGHPMTDISYLNAITRDHRKLTSLFEVIGSILAMVCAISIAMNIGAEMLGFSLLLVSSALFSGWTIVDRRWTFLVLQVFYTASAIIWLIRWA